MKNEWFASSKLKEKYCKVSDTGMPEIYIFPKKRSNVYALCAFKFGSVDNIVYNKNGIAYRIPDGTAHFLEHKMFADSDGKDAIEKFAAMGADANAYTDYDRTVYLFNTTNDYRDPLKTLLNMVTHPYFTKENIEKEQGIISEEIKMYENDPDTVCLKNMLEAMYKEHPIRYDICGSSETISCITPEILYDCCRTYYNTDNMFIVVCGDVEADEVINIVYDTVQSSETIFLRPPVAPDFSLPYKKKISTKLQSALPVFSIGYKENFIESDLELRQRNDLIDTIIERTVFGSSGELYNKLFDKGIISSSLTTCRILDDSYALTQLGGLAHDPEKVYDRINTYIYDLKKRHLNKDDVERSKKVLLAESVIRFDYTEKIANSLIDYAFDGLNIFSDTDIYRSITYEEIECMFQKKYTEDTSVLSSVYPI